MDRKIKALEKMLDELKFYRGVLVGLIIGIFGFLLTNYKNADNAVIVCGIGALIIIFVVWIVFVFAINNKIKEIGG